MWHTCLRVLRLAPKRKVLHNALMAVEWCRESRTRGQSIRGREETLIAFEIFLANALDIERKIVHLAATIMTVAMERRDDKSNARRGCLRLQKGLF